MINSYSKLGDGKHKPVQVGKIKSFSCIQIRNNTEKYVIIHVRMLRDP